MFTASAVATLAAPRAIQIRAASVFDSAAVRVVTLALILAHLLDIITTVTLLSQNASELNPFSAAVIHAYGFSGLIVEKTAVIGITVYNIGRMGRGAAVFTGAMATLITMAVVVWNLHAVVG